MGSETTTLAGQVAALQGEISALEAQIAASQTKLAEVQAHIARAQAQLDQKRALLAANLHHMYTDDSISTLEMLASSKNFSDFVDQSQYHQSVESKVYGTVNEIKALQKRLDAEKQSVEQLLADQTAMQARLNTQRAEVARLLALKTAEQQVYTQNIAATNAEVARLRQQQAAENARGFISRPAAPLAATPRAASRAAPSVGSVVKSGGGSYPWANVPFPNELPDPWGMYKRQCVSYAAWKVANSGRHMPYWGGRGNAKQWDDNARGAGIPVDDRPRAGDVAISNAGAYGHAMYVESVNGDGTITISQYNAGWDGAYSEGRRPAAGLVFIHF